MSFFAIVALPLAINVLQFGANGNGKVDNTLAFQAALNYASSHKIGEVDVPSGNFLFQGQIVIPVGVALKGTWQYVPSHPGLRDQGAPRPNEGGSTFLVEFGRGLSYNPLGKAITGQAFLNLNSNSLVEGIVIDYPQQVTQFAPIPYPFSISIRGNNAAVKNVELLNSYDGIDATNCARFFIRNVDGQPIHRGVVVDAIYDIGRIENVHFNPWFSFETPVYKWEMKHGVAFVFGRSDWQYCTNTFCFGYRVGYQFVATKNGSCNGNFLGIGADNCTNAVDVRECAPYGLLITNGEFTSFKGKNPTEVLVEKSNSGVIHFTNCSFWGPSYQIAHIDGQGTVNFADCTFCDWDSKHLGLPAINVVGGKIIIHDCEFQKKGKDILVGPAVKSSAIHDNLKAQ